MKKISQNTWIKIALSILDALLVYLPNYAAVDQGLKGRCAIFFIIAVVLLWLPMELKSSIFALNFYYELGLILIIIFLMTNQMAMKFTIGPWRILPVFSRNGLIPNRSSFRRF